MQLLGGLSPFCLLALVSGRFRRPWFFAMYLGGAGLIALASNSLVLSFRHDEVEGEDAELVGTFLSELSDWRDILRDVGPGGSVEAAASLSPKLRELEAAGFRVFAGRVRELRSSEHEATPWPVVVLHVRRTEMVPDTEVIEAAVE